jgi:hypothetical protein
MFGRCGYSTSYIPGQDILVFQLLCGKLLLIGPLCPVGSQAQCVALNLLCAVGAIG